MSSKALAIRTRLWAASRPDDYVRRDDDVRQDGFLFSRDLVRRSITELLLEGSARDGKVAKTMLGLEWAGTARDRLGFELVRLAEEDASRARALAMWPDIGRLPSAVRSVVMSVDAKRTEVESRFEGLLFFQTGVAIGPWSEQHVVKSPALGFHEVFHTPEEAEAVLRLKVLPHLIIGAGEVADVDGATVARAEYRRDPGPKHATVDFYAPSLYGLTEQYFLAMNRDDLEMLALKLGVRYSTKRVGELRSTALAAARSLTHYVNTTGVHAEVLLARDGVGQGGSRGSFAAKALAYTHMCVYNCTYEDATPPTGQAE